MFHFEGVEKDENGEGSEYGGSGAVNGIAASVQTVIAVYAQVTVANYIDDNDEGEQRCSPHNKSIDENI